MDRCEAPLLRYVGGLLPADAGEEAEDIVQEAFLRLHREIGRNGEDSVLKASAWLFTVSRNLVMDARRKKLRDNKAREGLQNAAYRPAAGKCAMDELVQREARERAMAELGLLSVQQREILLLKVTRDLKLREIAELMDMSVSNVAYHLNHGLQCLAKRLRTTA